MTLSRTDSLRVVVLVQGPVVPLLVLKRYQTGTTALESLLRSKLPRVVVPLGWPVIPLLVLTGARPALPFLEGLLEANFPGAVVPLCASVVPLYCQEDTWSMKFWACEDELDCFSWFFWGGKAWDRKIHWVVLISHGCKTQKHTKDQSWATSHDKNLIKNCSKMQPTPKRRSVAVATMYECLAWHREDKSWTQHQY
jgi:hypothetical protein